MSTLELERGGHEKIKAGIEEIKNTAWEALSEAASPERLCRYLWSIVAKSENLRQTVQSVLLVAPGGDERATA